MAGRNNFTTGIDYGAFIEIILAVTDGPELASINCDESAFDKLPALEQGDKLPEKILDLTGMLASEAGNGPKGGMYPFEQPDELDISMALFFQFPMN